MVESYLTTAEAAQMLGISPQRVTQLIAQGDLNATRMGHAWLVERESVALRASIATKKGGRPRRGEAKNERRFTLMNRTHEVLELVYNTNRAAFTHIGRIIDRQRTPMGVLGKSRASQAVVSFDAWWRGRGIPGSRANITRLLDDAGVDVPEELIMRNLGLSLSDQYWIRPHKSNLLWEDINFFNNTFDEVSQATDAYAPVKSAVGAHPDNTSDGNLAKHWIMTDSGPSLVKQGGRLDQEPYNELVATRLHQRLLAPGEYVPYQLVGSGSQAVSSCPCFVTDEEEFIPALYVDRILPKRHDMNGYQHFVACCASLDIQEADLALAKMIVCDDILANADRHYRNFGIVRNVNTLACRMAPIFDSGSSLWCDVSLDDLARGEFSFQSKQFEQSPARQLLLVEDMSWFEPEDLDGFVDEAMSVLGKNPLMQERLPYIRRSLQRRVDRIVDIREWG